MKKPTRWNRETLKYEEETRRYKEAKKWRKDQDEITRCNIYKHEKYYINIVDFIEYVREREHYIAGLPIEEGYTRRDYNSMAPYDAGTPIRFQRAEAVLKRIQYKISVEKSPQRMIRRAAYDMMPDEHELKKRQILQFKVSNPQANVFRVMVLKDGEDVSDLLQDSVAFFNHHLVQFTFIYFLPRFCLYPVATISLTTNQASGKQGPFSPAARED
ncbi:hypothetical protein QVD17_28606 [Tagetes erecta]|uniref:Uncharacterized protein n=1 Tax=Tagetes erecta TaxID=13708 RepID=A0AAD8KAW0_TARER|nr:hypothetical protein QVD17_28606 [Tagetes erecta]